MKCIQQFYIIRSLLSRKYCCIYVPACVRINEERRTPMEPFYKNEYRNQLEELFAKSSLCEMDNKKALELLLLFTLPIHEAGPVAERLINRFGSFSAVINADFDSLIEVGGMDRDSAVLITLVKNLNVRTITEGYENIKVLNNHAASRKYFTSLIGLNHRECVYCAFTDKNMNIISCDALCAGELKFGSEELSKCCSLADKYEAFSVILAYKTFSSNLAPDEKTVEFIRELRGKLLQQNMLLNDVIIVGRDTSKAFSNEVDLALYL